VSKIGFSQKMNRPMPYTKVMIHYIWSTKNRDAIISDKLKPLLINHILANSKEKGIFIDSINCVKDHIHILISLGTDQTIAKVAMMIRGESSFWVNKQKIINTKFEWQEEYIALSVSQSAIDNVKAYIDNQEEHHSVKTFSEEYDAFLKAHNFLAKAN
jgi:REP element-mobilizing transposase RayT